MERITRMRALILVVIFLAVALFYGFKLYDMQVLDAGSSYSNRRTFTTLTRVKAARGDILDRNGNLLVGNRASFDLVLNHYVLLSASGTNDHLLRLAQRCDELGISYMESFPVTRERPFTYTLSEQSSTQQSYFQTYLRYMGGLDSDITAPVLIQHLRDIYGFPDEWTDDEARKVIGLRYEMALRNCIGSLSNYVFLYDASEEALAAVEELSVPGMYVEPSTVREYTTDYAAHVLGYVGAMSPAQWEYYKDIDGYPMDAEIGQSGFEAAFEEYLHGIDGMREDTVSTDGTLLYSRWIQEPKAGANVKVTLDLNMQRAAEEEMAKVAANLLAKGSGSGSDIEGISVVAMDVNTGQVLVCASYPSYDPDLFHYNYNQLIADPLRPTYNRALHSIYPPGSTYKMSMVIAGIHSGEVSVYEEIPDLGVFTKYSGFAPTCLAYSSWGGVHLHVNAMEALKVSCNYYFYELGDRISLKAMDDTAKALGLGEKTGVELFEYSGYRANEETKAELYSGDYWSDGDRVLAAIGQSDNRFTPIQLCSYVATLANRGTRYKATFLNRIESSDYRQKLLESSVSVLSQFDISDDAYFAYTTGMYQVANEYSGTAYSVFGGYPVKVAAKTGTAQHGQTGRSDHGAFVCYAPADATPEIAVSVYGEYAGSGAAMGTIARAVLDVYFSTGEASDVITYENKIS